MESGKTCYHHSSQQAVAQCGVCGKGICEDCREMYEIPVGSTADKALCYDCGVEGMEGHAKAMAVFGKILKTKMVFKLVGAVIGAVLGGVIIGSGGGGVGAVVFGIILFALLGSCVLDILRAFGLLMHGGLGNAVKGFVKICIAPINTVVEIAPKLRDIKETYAIVASETQTTDDMKEYFAYTKVIEKNAGVKLATLMASGSALLGNKYAKAVLDGNGSAAKEALRRNVNLFYDNNEKVRSFFPSKE